MLFENRSEGNKVVVEVNTKDLDSSVAKDFREHLASVFETDPDTVVVVDLSKVRFLDSSCLGALLAAFRDSDSAQKVALAAPQEPVANVFHIARVSRIMKVVDSVDAALFLDPDSWAVGA